MTRTIPSYRASPNGCASRNQQISAADLIAAETTARGLAALRGHAEVWRTDLVDGITGALVKEELTRPRPASAARRRP